MGDMGELKAAIGEALAGLSGAELVEAVNALREEIHRHSPFRAEPVDCVLWVKIDTTRANDYNPNAVAPPEMRLLCESIRSDGFTQPVVTWLDESGREVVDGFHRRRVASESPEVRDRLSGYLPVTTIRADRTGRNDRMAATIRHNRARGRHAVDQMSEIVVELTRRNWSQARIARELGMDNDEVLRLQQVSGLAEMFANEEFSEAWTWREQGGKNT